MNQDQDNNVDSLPPDLEASIRGLTKELFIASKLETPRINDPEYAKLQNMSEVAMLNEVEQMVNAHLEIFDEFDKIDPVQFKALKKEIRK